MGINPIAAQQERMAMMLENAQARRQANLSSDTVSVDARMQEAIRRAAQQCGPDRVDCYA